MLKIRWSHDCLIFNMGISIPGKDGLYIETEPRSMMMSWHGMIPMLLAFVRGIHQSQVDSTHERSVMPGFDIFIDVRLNKFNIIHSWVICNYCIDYLERTAPCLSRRDISMWRNKITRNCSKLRKIHSGQGPISLTINPSEFKFFGQFALLWFKFSWCQLMSLQFLHITSMTRDPSTSIPVYCQGMRKICSDDQKMKYDKMKF